MINCEKPEGRVIALQKEIGIKLTPRLKAVADAVLSGQPMADIGSDHAYLPIYLVQAGLIPAAIAIEVRQGPWDKAQRQVRFYGLKEQIEVRLGSGLLPVQPAEVATVVLAGMGTQTIIDILTNAKHNLHSFQRLVIQPMVEVALMRKWLYCNGWHLVEEDLVQEGGRYYVVLVAKHGAKPLPSEIDLELGPCLLIKKHQLLIPYLDKLIKKERKILKALKKARIEENIRQRQKLQVKIIELEEVRRWLSCAKH